MDMSKVITLDVSELEPPHPMHQITAKLQLLTIGEVLLVTHRRKPIPLFDMITGQFEYACHQVSDERYQIVFWRAGDEEAALWAQQLTKENLPR